MDAGREGTRSVRAVDRGVSVKVVEVGSGEGAGDCLSTTCVWTVEDGRERDVIESLER